MDAILESHIAAALGRDRAPADSRGNGRQSREENQGSAWQKDYGSRSAETQKAALDSARLSPDGGWSDDSSGSDLRKGRVVNSDRRSRTSLWYQVMTAICPGTRNLFIGVSFAAVLMYVA